MSMSVRIYGVLALMAGIVFGLSSAGLLYVMRPGAPITEHSAQVVTTPVRPGGEVLIRYDNERNRACPSLIYGFLVDEQSGRAVVRYAPEPGGYGLVGRRKVDVVRPVPGDIRAGRYCYRHMIQHVCENEVFITVGVDACFDVQGADPPAATRGQE